MNITIKGFGSVPCRIDTIDFSLKLTTYGGDSKDVIEKEKKSKEKMISALKNIKKDIDLVFLSSDIRKDYRTEKNKTLFSGFRMEEYYRFSFSYDALLLVSFLSLVYKREDSELSLSYSFSSSMEKENQIKAMEEAVYDAKKKAEAIARSLGSKIVAIKDIRFDSVDSTPYLCASMEEVKAEDKTVTSIAEVVFIAE